MKNRSKNELNNKRLSIQGLGHQSIRKSYYPELQKKIQEFKENNARLVKEIEEKKKSENALKKSEELYRTLADNSADGIAIIQNQKLVYINPAFEEIFGYTKQQLRRMNLVELLHSDYRQPFLDMVQRLKQGSQTENIDVLCIRGDKTNIWVNDHSRAIAWQGQPAVLGTVRDITQKKEMEARSIESMARLESENRLLKSQGMPRHGLGSLIGKSEPMQTVYEKIILSAAAENSVVIYGESGTGKELVARTIHDLSPRHKKPFIPVNCGAIPDNLFESEFFGYQKGAFSGATTHKLGLLEAAEGGTLFLDEIGEIPLHHQVKLLRAIEGGGFTPVGSTTPKKVDFRIITATNRNLNQLVDSGTMRKDFFYRIHIIPIHIPPLRERIEDLEYLTSHFVRKLSPPGEIKAIPLQLQQWIQGYHWPGNIRELENTLAQYLTLNTMPSTKEDHGFTETTPCYPGQAPCLDESSNLTDSLNRYEKQLIDMALEKTGGNKSRAAKMLGIERRSLQRKITRHQSN
ncbi:sigma-54-dependent Fis family transcriptional regulator [Desulfoluna limicola]|uniref:Sigma-54-dependent Fis family transcriptional regulator n=1 Tax=Desulfoluna limicola TaxID=2810562 RepID=A0ABN6EZU2_9BACT|nr:sigma 54-interacting transcriptional regulator [Desulfoluna limicola]BCS95008.1 sigma-54-dependent Fis family transcriptional regulator [Desulfoluna limicola]